MALLGTIRDTIAATRLHAARTKGRQRAVRPLLAGLVLGLGIVTVGSGLAQAQEGGLGDFFARLFGRPTALRQPQVAQPERARPKRYVALPDHRRVTALHPRYTPRPLGKIALNSSLRGRSRSADRTQPANAPIPSVVRLPVGAGQQTVCVRTCDGFLFPIGKLQAAADLPVHKAACAAACPGAGTKLFTAPAGTDLDQAISLTGQPYLSMAFAKVYQARRVENCACRPANAVLAPLPLSQDATVRVGDVVATDNSAKVVTQLIRNKPELTDYRTAPGLSRQGRNAIEVKIGRLARDAREAGYRRTRRVADAGTAQLRRVEGKAQALRQADATRLSDLDQDVGDAPMDGQNIRQSMRMVGVPYFPDYR